MHSHIQHFQLLHAELRYSNRLEGKALQDAVKFSEFLCPLGIIKGISKKVPLGI